MTKTWLLDTNNLPRMPIFYIFVSFVTAYHPAVKLKHILMEHWNLINIQPFLKIYFFNLLSSLTINLKNHNN